MDLNRFRKKQKTDLAPLESPREVLSLHNVEEGRLLCTNALKHKSSFFQQRAGWMRRVGFAFWEKMGVVMLFCIPGVAREQGHRLVLRCGIYRGERREKGEEEGGGCGHCLD